MIMKKFDEYMGKEVHSIILSNEKMELELIDFGATLVRCVLKENNADVIQGLTVLMDICIRNAIWERQSVVCATVSAKVSLS